MLSGRVVFLVARRLGNHHLAPPLNHASVLHEDLGGGDIADHMSLSPHVNGFLGPDRALYATVDSNVGAYEGDVQPGGGFDENVAARGEHFARMRTDYSEILEGYPLLTMGAEHGKCACRNTHHAATKAAPDDSGLRQSVHGRTFYWLAEADANGWGTGGDTPGSSRRAAQGWRSSDK